MGSAMTYQERQRSMFLLGPWLIGSFVEVFLQGALWSQFIRYFSWYSSDRAGTRLAVAGLALFTTLKAIHSFATLWITFVLNFTDLERAITLSSATWWGAGNTLMVASIGVYVEIFYCHRLWIISKKNIPYLLIIGTVLLFGYISVCVATYGILHGTGDIQMWFAAHLSAVFAGDLLITLTTAFYLLKSRKAAVLPRTAGIFTALVRLTFQTAAPASLCAMLNLIFSQIYVGEDKLISAAFNQALPTLYGFSMMWTLNARRSIRDNGESHISIDLAQSGDSPLHQRAGAVELAVYNQRIQVRTQTEVTQHRDIDSNNFETKGSDELKTEGLRYVV